MDFMKVFDRAVREIKREVNLKVLKVTEIEQKVLDATDDEPWGPHGTVLAEIAQATKNLAEYQMVLNVLWTRLTSKNWRLIYKALAVIEYLVAHGSEDAVDDIIEHTYQISSLASFEYVEPSGKDLGINVRKKAETISALLNDPDKVQEVRSKAAASHDKYVGLSSSGLTYRTGAASFSIRNFSSSDRYRGFGNAGDSDTFKSSYKYRDQYHKEKDESTKKSMIEPLYYSSKKLESATTSASTTSRKTNQSDAYALLPSQNAPSDKYDEDFDDFDPRGTSNSKSSTGSNHVDLFEGNFVDLIDGPISLPIGNSTSMKNDPSQVDLFADTKFVSAIPEPEAGESSVTQINVDLFASRSALSLSTKMDFVAAADPVSQADDKAHKSNTASGTVDPFAAILLNNFHGSDLFGAFSSHTDPWSTLSNNSSPKGGSDGNTHESDPVETQIHGNMNAPSVETKTALKKQTFQVSSAIWADSFSRGLIDLNITASNKLNLADVRVVGRPTEDKLPSPSFYTGGSISNGSGMSKSGFSS